MLTMRNRFAFLVLCGGLMAAAPAPDPCATPNDLVQAPAPLPGLAAHLHPGGVLRVLVVGSATVFGPEAALAPGTITSMALGTPGAPGQVQGPPTSAVTAFPEQMAVALRQHMPGLRVQVTVQGGRGMTAAAMLELIRRNVAGHGYDLVIWQTGTVEAVRNVPPGDFYQTLQEGAAAVQEAGAELVLVDPQFSRFLHANSNLDPYAQGLQQIAATPGVVLFHRFDIMRAWANDGQIDLERTPKAERIRAVEQLHACLGQQLARLMMNAAAAP